jgi:hypothetical protein
MGAYLGVSWMVVDDLAHRNAGDAHVGLLGQLHGLRELDVEAPALGLEGDRAAEGQPQEHEQAEAGQREADHGEDPPGGRYGLLH